MSWHLYNIMCNYGDLLPTKFSCNTGKLQKELEPFKDKWKKFNPGKPHILRDGLSVTSMDGGFDGNDLDMGNVIKVKINSSNQNTLFGKSLDNSKQRVA